MKKKRENTISLHVIHWLTAAMLEITKGLQTLK